MRVAALLALPALLCAQAKDGKQADAFWGYEITLPGLEEMIGLGELSLVYVGRAGSVVLTVRVHETEQEKPVGQWVAERKARDKDGDAVVSHDNWLVFRKKDRVGFVKAHGWAYFVRGAQCFEVHAEAEGEKATQAAVRAVQSFKLRADAPGTLVAHRIARTKRKPRDDPRVLLAAGFEYLTGPKYRVRSRLLAAKVLAQARARMKKDTFKPLELWSLYEYGGLALADQPARAIEWHALAEKAAAKLKERSDDHRRTSAYNLACAHAGAKKPDEAFAALYRSYEGGKPVPDANVSGDKRLENLRRDERWHKFWSDCVKR